MKDYELFGMDPRIYRPYEIPIYGAALVYRRIFNAASKYLQGFGLSVIKFNVLAIIEYQGRADGISQVDISKRVIVTASNIARLLERMEKEGLIKRFPHKTDRRVNIIKNTAKAKQLVEKLWNGYDELVRNIAGRLTQKEQKTISTLMAKWFVSLEK